MWLASRCPPRGEAVTPAFEFHSIISINHYNTLPKRDFVTWPFLIITSTLKLFTCWLAAQKKLEREGTDYALELKYEKGKRKGRKKREKEKEKKKKHKHTPKLRDSF